MNLDFTTQDVIVLIGSAVVGVWYFLKKHWIANNLFGLAFAINGVELLHLNKVLTGCILLGGLFFYDIFWVFGTNVMVTVAKSFEAPIKLVFPQDLLENGLAAQVNILVINKNLLNPFKQILSIIHNFEPHINKCTSISEHGNVGPWRHRHSWNIRGSPSPLRSIIKA